MKAAISCRQWTALFAILISCSCGALAEDAGPLEKIRSQIKAPNEPFTLVVIVDIKSEGTAKFKDSFTITQKETRKEAGNIGYEMHESAEKPGRFLIIEKWSSLPAMEKHFQEPYVTQLFAVAGEVLAGSPEFHVLIPSVPPGKADPAK